MDNVMKFTIHVYPSRGHQSGHGGDGYHRGSDMGRKVNGSEMDRYDQKRSDAVDQILRARGLDRFATPERRQAA